MLIAMFRKLTIMLAFAAIQKFLISRVTFLPLKKWFEQLINPAQDVADLLTDRNPNNAEQRRQFWEQNQDRLTDGSLETAIEIIRLKVPDETIRDLIIEMLKEVINDGVQGRLPASNV